MRTFRLAAALLVLAVAVFGQAAPRLSYQVEVKDGDFEAFHHQLEIDRPDVPEVTLAVAAWAPGSYRLLNTAEQIEGVVATDQAGGARAIKHPDKLTWIVDAKDATKLTVRWHFTKPGKGVNNRSYLTKNGGLLDGPRNYLYWHDHKDLPAHVRFKLPPDWKIGTGLTPTFDPTVFTARNTDWLLDCPALLGRIELWPFEVKGVPMRVAYDNQARAVTFNKDGLVECCRRIADTASDIMGGVPYEHYTFIFSNGGGGGLEHLTSTTIGTNSAQLKQDPYAHQGVIAHEFFHAWNVKRLRPKALGPFNYDGPVRTKSLWISEGITNYYTQIILARAGLIDEQQFVQSFQGTISGFIANEASRVISPEEASWSVWDGPYMMGPISYYTQGEILGLLLDLELRGRTGNTKSFDDVMRLLYKRYSGPAGFQSEDVVATVLDATGIDLHDFFLKHVSAAQEIDWNHYFRRMGYRATLDRRQIPAVSLQVTGTEGGVRVRVEEGSAFGRAGLKTGDIVLAVGKDEVASGGALTRALRKIDIGATAELKVKRGEGEPIVVKVPIEPASDVSNLRLKDAEGRLVVCWVSVGSPLERSGRLEGDQLVAVDGRALGSLDEARSALSAARAGTEIKLTVNRSGAEQIIVHRVGPRVALSLRIEADPAATPAELEVRRALLGLKAESRPTEH